MPAAIKLTPEHLAKAAKESTQLSEFYEALGYTGRPGGSSQDRIRRLLSQYDIDTSHFIIQRGPHIKWSKDDLTAAIECSTSWSEVASRLGSAINTVKRHCKLYGLSSERLDARDHMVSPTVQATEVTMVKGRLRDASEPLAEAWYMLHGFQCYRPEAASRCDILAERDGVFTKVQVKTASGRTASGWSASITSTRKRDGIHRRYTANEVDEFFIIALDGSMYRIPFAAVEDKAVIALGAKYEQYRVPMFATDTVEA